MNLDEFRCVERLRVRWAEIDAQQIVFNGHYLTYLDTMLAAYWRALALPYAQTMEQLGGDLYLRKATLDYLASARYDEMLDVGIRCASIGNSSIRFLGAVFRGEELLVTGELIYVFADPATQTSKAVPAALRAALDGYEAGEPAIAVRAGRWSELGQDAHPIRRAVFVDEQKIPAELEWDDADDGAIHAVAYNRLGRALATGRMIETAPGVGKIGRMAVARAMRGGGVGRHVLEALLDAARVAGYREVLLHAQVSAAAFYRRAGFSERGERFLEAGIPHVEMVRAP